MKNCGIALEKFVYFYFTYGCTHPKPNFYD